MKTVDNYRVWFEGNVDTMEKIKATSPAEAAHVYSKEMYDAETDADPLETRIVVVQARTKDFDVVSTHRFAVNTDRNPAFHVREMGT